jgi:hypothetical protein
MSDKYRPQDNKMDLTAITIGGVLFGVLVLNGIYNLQRTAEQHVLTTRIITYDSKVEAVWFKKGYTNYKPFFLVYDNYSVVLSYKDKQIEVSITQDTSSILTKGDTVMLTLEETIDNWKDIDPIIVKGKTLFKKHKDIVKVEVLSIAK